MNRDQMTSVFDKFNSQNQGGQEELLKQEQGNQDDSSADVLDSPQESGETPTDQPPIPQDAGSGEEREPINETTGKSEGEADNSASEDDQEGFSFDIDTDPQNPFSTQQPSVPDSSIESVDQLLNLPLSDELKNTIQQQLQKQSTKQAGPFEGISENTAAAIRHALESGAVQQGELEGGFDPRTGHVARLNQDGDSAAKEYAATFFRREAMSRGYKGKEVDDYVQESLDNHEDSLFRFARREAEDQDRRTGELIESYRSERSKFQENLKSERERQERQQTEYRENVLRTLRDMEQIPGTTTKMEQGLKARIYESAINPDKLAQSIKQGLGDNAKAPQIIRALSMMFDGQRVINDLQTAAAADAKRSMVDRGRSPGGSNGVIPTKHDHSPSRTDQGLDFIRRKTPSYRRQ